MGNRAYGYTTPDGFGTTSTSYTEIDNDFTDPLYTQTRGLDALRVTLAHEFFHLIHYGLYAGVDALWWFEATSTWMEDVAYPEVNDYLQYVPEVLYAPARSIDSGTEFGHDLHIYGMAIFVHFLERFFDRGLILDLWQEIGRYQSPALEHFDQVIRRHDKGGGGLPAAMDQFAVWNYFTSERHHSDYYVEGHLYPKVRSTNLIVPAGETVLDSGRVDHMGAAYLALRPQLRPGGVRITTDFGRGQWSTQVILIGDDEAVVLPVRSNFLEVGGWDRYRDVVLVLTETDLSGHAFPFRVEVDHDSLLTDSPPPRTFVLRPSRPNPFVTDGEATVWLRFNLARASKYGRLSILATDGVLVRQFPLEGLPARPDSVEWNGRNQAGALVTTGVYYYVLEIDGDAAWRQLALVRKR